MIGTHGIGAVIKKLHFLQVSDGAGYKIPIFPVQLLPELFKELQIL
jgi:hypothetical protein